MPCVAGVLTVQKREEILLSLFYRFGGGGANQSLRSNQPKSNILHVLARLSLNLLYFAHIHTPAITVQNTETIFASTVYSVHIHLLI